MTTTIPEAAAARSAGMRAVADRPRQRRSAEAGTAFRVSFPASVSLVEREAVDGGNVLRFEGYASVTEYGYEMWDFFGPYTEVVSAGAFTDTLNRADLDVPLVLGHDQLRRIARTTNGTLQLSEDAKGLHVLADLDPNDQDVAYIATKLSAGLIDEMSFAFRIDGGRWSPDYTEYRIDKVDIHRGDTAIVGYGANPGTAGSKLLEETPAAERAAVLRTHRETQMALSIV